MLVNHPIGVFSLKYTRLPPQRCHIHVTENTASRPAAPIAVVGMGCHFPSKCTTPKKYWEFLRDGRCAITRIPESRWDVEKLYDPDPRAPGKMYSRHGAFLDQAPDQFDASFFGISPHEAWPIDPSQRLLLEVAWESLEHAGIPPHSLEGSKTGVFAGVADSEYLVEQSRSGTLLDFSAYHALTAPAFGAGRISYLLGLEGPAVSIDTACSSSLVATLLAIESLRNGDSDLALAGGTHLMLTPVASAVLCRMTALSVSGRSRVFDAQADGFVRGEGAGMIVLKRLDDALANGDRVLATILGGAWNHDGRSSSLATPRQASQERAIRDALRNTGLKAADIDYIEAHGTGTPVGDPIEATAIGNALAQDRGDRAPLWVGSGKTNIGHLEAASGIAALIKVVMSLQNEEIPPHINFDEPSPDIEWDRYHMSIPSKLTPWTSGGRPRVASINSFGLSGTNAHIILSEGRSSPNRPAPSGRYYLLPVSARTPDALRAISHRYGRALEERPELELRDACYTAAVGRNHDRKRLAVVGETREEVVSGLRNHSDKAGKASPIESDSVAFLFTGQGAQYPGMARGLFDSNTLFRAALTECDEILADHLEHRLLDLLYDESLASLISRTEYTQPAMVAIELALVEVWRSWGIHPTHVLGHSLGEYSAAVAAKVMTRETALRLVALRGAMMRDLTKPGAMRVAFADEGAVRAAVDKVEGVSIAAVNGPTNTVLSASFEVMDETEARLDEAGIGSQALEVSHAFHSALMDPMLEPFRDAVAAVRLESPALAMVSNLTGRVGEASRLTSPTYWSQHVREAVRFADSISTLEDAGVRTFVEIGPHPTLLGMAGLNLSRAGGLLVPSLRRGQPDERQLLEAAAAMYEAGHDLDWHSVPTDKDGRVATLPNYPFQRRRHWYPTDGTGFEVGRGVVAVRPTDDVQHPLLGTRLRSPDLHGVSFQSLLLPSQPRFLGSYRVRSNYFVPEAALVEMAHAGARHGLRWQDFIIEDLRFDAPLAIPKKDGRICQVILSDGAEGLAKARVVSIARSGSGNPRWITHLSATVRRSGHQRRDHELSDLDWSALRERCSLDVSADTLYDVFKAEGLRLGDFFKPIQRLSVGESEALTEVRLVDALSHESNQYTVHPALLQSVFQTARAVDTLDEDTPGGEVSLVSVGSSWIGPMAGSGSQVYARSTPHGDQLRVDVVLADAEDRTVARFQDVVLERRRIADRVIAEDEWSHGVYWHRRATTPSDFDAHGHWLIVNGNDSLAADLASALAELGGTPHLVPSNDQSASEIVEGLRDAGVDRLRGVVHAAGVYDTATPSGGDQRLEIALDLVEGTVDFLKALANRDVLDGPFWMLTRGATDVSSTNEPRCLESACLWGLLSVARSEFMNLDVRVLDLEPASSQPALQSVLDELAHGDDETRVAYRGGDRHLARLEPFRGTGPTRDQVVRPDGAYLVTGGLGWIGRAVAHWLFRQGAGLVVLNARRAPDRDTSAWIQSLRNDGHRVEVILGDVAESAQVDRLFEDIDRLDMPLAGVFHAAGAINRKVLSTLSREDARTPMAAKIAGSWHLHRHTCERSLDLFVLFGSAGALLGRSTQGAYAAANAYLPALAALRRDLELPATCVEWGLWGGGGMLGVVQERELEVMADAGMALLSPEPAMSVLEEHLRESTDRVTIAAFDWANMSAAAAGLTVEPFLSELVETLEREIDVDAGSVRALLEELAATDPEEREERLAELICSQIAEVMGVATADVPRDQDARLSGLDSLMALDLRHRLEASVGLTMPPPGPFGSLSPNALAKTLAEGIPEALEQPAEESEEAEWTEGEI